MGLAPDPSCPPSPRRRNVTSMRTGWCSLLFLWCVAAEGVALLRAKHLPAPLLSAGVRCRGYGHAATVHRERSQGPVQHHPGAADVFRCLGGAGRLALPVRVPGQPVPQRGGSGAASAFPHTAPAHVQLHVSAVLVQTRYSRPLHPAPLSAPAHAACAVPTSDAGSAGAAACVCFTRNLGNHAAGQGGQGHRGGRVAPRTQLDRAPDALPHHHHHQRQ